MIVPEYIQVDINAPSAQNHKAAYPEKMGDRMKCGIGVIIKTPERENAIYRDTLTSLQSLLSMLSYAEDLYSWLIRKKETEQLEEKPLIVAETV
jgi:hypothetical protein